MVGYRTFQLRRILRHAARAANYLHGLRQVLRHAAWDLLLQGERLRHPHGVATLQRSLNRYLLLEIRAACLYGHAGHPYNWLWGGHILVEEFREMRHVLRESFLPCGARRRGRQVLANGLIELLLQHLPRVRVQCTRRGRRQRRHPD